MRHSTSQTLFAYWNKVRGDRIAPLRFDIEPARIAGILPETMIVECSGAANFHFRLAGTRLSQQFGYHLRGTNLLNLFNRPDARILKSNLSVISGQGAAGVFHVRSDPASGPPVFGELILLPLLHNKQSVDRFLGAWSLDAPPGDQAISPYIRHSILDYELLWPRGRPAFKTIVKDQIEPTMQPIRHARVVRSERRQFRVYEGGRVD